MRLLNKNKKKKITRKYKKGKKWFILQLIGVSSLLFLNVLVFFLEEYSRLYYKTNNAIFITNLMVFLLFIGSKEYNIDAIKNILTQFKNSEHEYSLHDKGDILLFVEYLIAAFSTLLILDVSFISNYGIRIGGVVGVLLFRIIRNIFQARKDAK